jgi:hypothetical protein
VVRKGMDDQEKKNNVSLGETNQENAYQENLVIVEIFP